MNDVSIPEGAHVTYLGPELTPAAKAVVDRAGLELRCMTPDMADADLPDTTDVLVLGLGLSHPVKGVLQKEAVRRDIPVLSDLGFLTRMQHALRVPAAKRVAVTGSAGKTVTIAMLLALLSQGGQDAAAFAAHDGYLNALGVRTEVLAFHVQPWAVKDILPLELGSAAVLNLTDAGIGPIGEKARDACSELLSSAAYAVLGADDSGTQSLLMAVRRRSMSAAQALVPISGGATLSDGWFAIDRAIYSIRHGRTRRVAGFASSPVIIGDHFGQDAAAAASLASHYGVSDDHIAAGLEGFRGVAGRFDCVGAKGRIVFVDDRFASSETSSAAAIAACPEVFWVGVRTGTLPAKVEQGVRGRFFLAPLDSAGPPVDDVVTFGSAETATRAALRAAEEFAAREPAATPVVLFSPGAPGFDRQGEFFRLIAAEAMNNVRRAHG